MAKRRVEDTIPALEGWGSMNRALVTIADNQRTVEDFKAVMWNKIDEAKAETKARSRAFVKAIKRLGRQAKEFVEVCHDDMGGKKTRTLSLGAVGFHKSAKIRLPKVSTKLVRIIQLLRSKGMDDCMKAPTPSVDKDALRKHSTQNIVAVGASIGMDGVFWYESDREELERDQPTKGDTRMGTQANVLTPRQMHCIYALMRGGGIGNEDLHAVVFATTGKDSMKLLTTADAKQVVDQLERLTGQETTALHNGPTKEQMVKIYVLVAKLGWADDPKRLRTFLEKRFGASRPIFLGDKHTHNYIEAMKAILTGGCEGRKGSHDGETDGPADC